MSDFDFDDLNNFGSQSGNSDNFSNSFGESDDIFGDINTDSEVPDGAFSGAFDSDSDSNDFSDSPSDGGDGTSKKAIILIVIGFIALVIVLLLITIVPKMLNNKDDKQQIEQITQNSPVQQVGGDVSNIINTQVPTNTNENISNSNKNDWIEITNQEEVTFYEQKQEVMFTVTGIEHYAKKVDASGTLIMKTTLTGTLAGYPGTYTLDIPYDKGILVNTGMYFKVSIQVGNYKGNTVISEISTYIESNEN